MGFTFDSQDLIGDEDSALEIGFELLEEEDNSNAIPDELMEGEQGESEQEETEDVQDESDSDEIELEIKGKVYSLKQSDIEDLLEKHVSGELNSASDPDYALYKEAKPVMEKVRNSNVLRQFMAYSTQGYSDDEILNGMFYLKNPQLQTIIANAGRQQQQSQVTNEEPPEFESVEEEIRWHTRKELQQQMAPMQQMLTQLLDKSKQSDEQAGLRAINENNNIQIDKAMKKYNLTVIGDDEAKVMREILEGIYPGENLLGKKLTSVQAEILVQAALARQGKRNDKMDKPTDKTIRKKLPNILSTRNKAIGAEQSRPKSYKDTIDDLLNL